MTSGVNKKDSDDGTLSVMLKNSRTSIPNLLIVKERIDRGDTLSGLEIVELEEAFDRSKRMLGLYDEHPEVHDIVARIVSLYLHITNRALENETKR